MYSSTHKKMVYWRWQWKLFYKEWKYYHEKIIQNFFYFAILYSFHFFKWNFCFLFFFLRYFLVEKNLILMFFFCSSFCPQIIGISANSARRSAASLALELFEQHQGTHILQSLDGFALALAADGRFLYISETVSIYLGLSQVRIING